MDLRAHKHLIDISREGINADATRVHSFLNAIQDIGYHLDEMLMLVAISDKLCCINIFQLIVDSALWGANTN